MASTTTVAPLLYLYLPFIFAACYNRDGTQIQDSVYQPCNNDTTEHSACCGLRHTANGDKGIADDICESIGLCQNWGPYTLGSPPPEKLWWRQGCTDPKWKSEFCLGAVCDENQVRLSVSQHTEMSRITETSGSQKTLQCTVVGKIDGVAATQIVAVFREKCFNSLLQWAGV
jgi:hypothetical protein